MKYIGLVGGLFLLGYWLSEYFLRISLWIIEQEGVTITTQNILVQPLTKVTFSIGLAIIPILHLLIKLFKKFKNNKIGIYSLVTIVTFGISGWLIRLLALSLSFQKFCTKTTHGKTSIIPFESLQFSEYFIGGLAVGAILCLFLFRRE